MTKIKLSEIIANERVVIHTQKEEQAKELCKRFDTLGRKWRSGKSYLENNYWKIYKGKTCYCPHNRTYGDTEFYKNSEYEIIKIKNVDLEK